MTIYTDSLNRVVPRHITSVYAYYPEDDDVVLFNEICRIISETTFETWIYLLLLVGSATMAVAMTLYVYRWAVYGYYDTDEYNDPKVVIVRRFISDGIDAEIEQMIDEYATRDYVIMDNRAVVDVSFPPSVKSNPRIVKRNMEYFMSRYLYRLAKSTRDIYIMSRNLYRSDYENYYQIANMAGWRVEIWDITVEDDSRVMEDDASKKRFEVLRRKEECIYHYDPRTTRNVRVVV